MIQVVRQRYTYIIADYVAANAAWLLFNVIRYYTLPYNYMNLHLGQYLCLPDIIIGQIVFPILMIGLYAVSGFYNHVFFKSRLDDLLNTAGVSLIGTVIIFFIALFNDGIPERMGNYEIIATLWSLLFVFNYIPRLIITSRAARRIRQGAISFTTLIVGTSQTARKLAEDLHSRYRHMGFNVVGYLTDDLRGEHGEDFDEICRKTGVQSFIIVPPSGKGMADSIGIINRLLPTGRPVYITPDLYQVITSRPRVSAVAGEVLVDVSRSHIPASTQNLKRMGDIVVSALALVVLLPVFCIIALLIKRDSPGPVFYCQSRIGYKKKPFKICKFRSMTIDAEPDGPALSSPTDQRVTRIGRFLRKYRIDELPQFWNVLKGEMSLVGPRPEREYYIRQIVEKVPYYSLIHQVRPGLTSWGMVKYGYASSVDQMIERLKYDLLYIENVSLVVDIKIMFYTVNTVLTGKGL